MTSRVPLCEEESWCLVTERTGQTLPLWGMQFMRQSDENIICSGTESTPPCFCSRATKRKYKYKQIKHSLLYVQCMLAQHFHVAIHFTHFFMIPNKDLDSQISRPVIWCLSWHKRNGSKTSNLVEFSYQWLNLNTCPCSYVCYNILVSTTCHHQGTWHFGDSIVRTYWQNFWCLTSFLFFSLLSSSLVEQH